MGDDRSVIEAVWRLEAPRILGALSRVVRDVDLAEQCAHDALVAALEQWPRDGTPESPGAWLLAVARRRLLDDLRRQRREQEGLLGLGRQFLERQLAASAERDDAFGDDVLRLMFLCCHPSLPPEARTALTLRLLGGLSTDEIARAYLVPEPTIAQRIVRAKRTLAEHRDDFDLPGEQGLAARTGAVLEVVYLMFNEGYAASSGERSLRVDLCEEALRLARLLAASLPRQAEVHGLAALLELQASRLPTRQGEQGDPVLLFEQDRSRWDRLLVQRGLAALAVAESLGEVAGPYVLQARIAACHARAATPAATDWAGIVAHYDQLLGVAPSPVVALNRAVAVAMAFGVEVGLYLVDDLAQEPALAEYHLLPSVRGELLRRLGRVDEARAEFLRAATKTGNAAERAALLRRAAACGAGG